MYNEELKRRYIDKKESEVIISQFFLKNMFLKTGPFEEKLQKDACSWTANEIIEFYKFLDLTSLESLSLINSNLAMYTSWCINETLVPDGQNHYQELDQPTLLSCVNTDLLQKSIITWEELTKAVESVTNYTDRFIFYALFEGMSGELFKEITAAKDGDIEGHTIHLCTGRDLEITSKTIEAAEAALAEEEYVIVTDDREKTLPYRAEDDGYYFRRIRNHSGETQNELANKAQALSRRFIKAETSIGLSRKMTPKRLLLSGKINFIKQIMKREGDNDLERVLRNHREEIDARYPVERLKSVRMFVQKYGVFFE